MGIQIEFNPDLALRKYGTRSREEKECLPEKFEVGGVYSFLKEGQRNYWLAGLIPLCETKGDGKLSRPLAAIRIIEATHFMENERVFTGGKYEVHEVFDTNDERIHFEGMNKRIIR
ncbi:MAG: hypothetical protein AABW75_02435 [Nanoarchaeota archaeon]